MSEESFDINEGDGEGLNTIWRDATFNLALFLLAILVVLLALVNEESKKANDDVPIFENVVVQITWTTDYDVDIDLWCQAPGDVPVGYSNLGGVVFNLMRDDLGHFFEDPLKVNLEECKGRGIIPGEYAVNIHMYANPSAKVPIVVNVVVSVKPTAKPGGKAQPVVPVLTAEETLFFVGEEVTVFRFHLTEDGEPQGVHNLFKPLRSAPRVP